MRGLTFGTIAFAVLATLFVPPRAHSAVDTLLTVGGDVDHPYALTASEFAKLPRTSVRAAGHDKKESMFEGVRLAELLRRAGVKLGADLRGPLVAQAVVVGAADGYRAVFAIAELDSGFTDRTVLVADRRDGAPTAADEGPLRIVATGDKRFGRWVRQVTSITVRKL